MVWVYWPGRDVATLLHEGSKGEPETVEDPKLIGGLVARQTVSALLGLLGVPLVRAEAADQEEHHAHADVGEHNAHPDLVGQRVQEGEDTRFGLLGLLDHDGDAQTHEGFREVNDLLPDQRNSQWGHSDFRFLEQQKSIFSL